MLMFLVQDSRDNNLYCVDADLCDIIANDPNLQGEEHSKDRTALHKQHTIQTNSAFYDHVAGT